MRPRVHEHVREERWTTDPAWPVATASKAAAKVKVGRKITVRLLGSAASSRRCPPLPVACPHASVCACIPPPPPTHTYKI
jgi:hypothetical protein